MRVLRNFNITRISDLELISNSTDRLDITFHFFGIKGDSNRIREAITRMVERGRIGNITLVSNFHHFDENPPLNLMDMTINQKSAIREDNEFIISCTAQGSSRMQFQWFKDGAVVNASKATREIWTTVLPPENKDIFTAILGVTKASRMDEGIYTCKVTDWGVEQCRSLHVHIRSPPRLRVDPASVTLQRGDSLRVRCLSPGNDDIKRYAQLGYSWTRNGVLFQSDPKTVMWEDLYPDGSILKINNIQKSAEYACIVSNTVKPVSKSVYITVIDRNAVHVCHAETRYGVHWPTSAPGAAIVSDCPRGFEGHSRRICEHRDKGNSSWLLPDFSVCIRDQLLEIYNKFRALSAGFQQSNSSAVLKASFEYAIRRYKNFLPGEAGFLIDMLHEVDSYLQLKGTQLEREMAAEIILRILDKVMQNPQSLNSQQQIKKLQLLTQSAALNRETIAASQLATSTSTSSGNGGPVGTISVASASSSSAAAGTQTDPASAATSLSTSASATAGRSATLSKADPNAGILTVDEDSLSLDRLNSLRIYMTSVKTLPFNLRIYGDDLFADQLYMEIAPSSHLINIMTNSTIFASVISYKNLKSFLPKTYYTRGSDPKENDYILASRIIQTWLFQSNRSNDNFREPLDLSFEAGHVEIIFQHENSPKDSDWVAVCGHDYKASFESTWRSDLCITKNLMDNITRCICPLSGTYVVMLTKRNYVSAPPHTPQRPLFVIISCACCLLQSCSAFIILLPIWYNRKCAITFLKMQFCVSTSSIMVIVLLGFLKMLPLNWHGVISSSLASLLLLGISTLIAIALVIHSELVPKKLLHVTKPLPTATKKDASVQQGLENRRSSASGGSGQISITNITQISSTTSAITSTNGSGKRALPPHHEMNLPSGIRGAIGISWLLPLLFAITSPLICSIIGKWPQNWWLQIMTATAQDREATATPSANDGYLLNHRTPALLNGDNSLERSPAYASYSNASAATVAVTLSTSITSSSDWTQNYEIFETARAADDSEDATLATTPSMNFIIFICVDLLFILLFFALFAILIRKLLWLWRKHSNGRAHPLDKISLAMQRRIGLLYRAGCLLVMKLSMDALFIAYVNSTQDSLWGYPFGISCVLLGFSILFCFVIKAECKLSESTSSSGSSGSSLKQKMSSSKTSLDADYCTGTINSPLNFYTNHEKEKENESGTPLTLTTLLPPPPQQIEMSAGVQLPLTIISTAPRCQMMPQMLNSGLHDHPNSGLGTFLGLGNLEHKGAPLPPQHLPMACLQELQHHAKGPTSLSSPATRCCNILGSRSADAEPQTQTLPGGGGIAYYNAYGGLAVGMTGSLSRRPHHQQVAHEFVGVETLDILQGVAADSIIGIRASAMLPSTQYHQQAQHHKPYVDAGTTILPSAMVSISGLTSSSTPISYSTGNHSTTSTTTTSVTTQTPKTQKRVTIMEPTTHTFDPMLPTMVAVASSAAATATSSTVPTPIITITSSSIDEGTNSTVTSLTEAEVNTSKDAPSTPTPDDENSINGMFDRITHDLDYLLNRTNELPADNADLPPPPPPPNGSSPETASSRTQGGIIEETDQEL